MKGRPWKCAGCGGQWSAARRPALILGAPHRLRLCVDCADRPRTVAAAAVKSGGLAQPPSADRTTRTLGRAHFRAVLARIRSRA